MQSLLQTKVADLFMRVNWPTQPIGEVKCEIVL